MSIPPELFVATDIVGTAQELQKTISEAVPDMTDVVAQQAMDVLGDVRELHGASKVALRTMSAFVVDRQLTLEEQLYGVVQFADLDVKGWFGGIRYARVGNALRSLCLDMYDVTILRPTEPDDPNEGRLDMPLLVPVLAVDNIWPME